MTLAIAMILDALLGEPKWLWSRLPHPAVVMGRLIGWIDKRFNNGTYRIFKGLIAIICLASGAIVLGIMLEQLPGHIAEVLIVAILLAQRSLVDHVAAVATGLSQSREDGQKAVAMIVSRDTAEMTESDIARSAIESAAENMSDGVIAPIFWFALGGLPGILLYKITNTADSMIGYRTPRHEKFGKAAARFDDFLNLIPARLTALLILTISPNRKLSGILRDAPRHRSPNAGWPEAAIAYGQNIALSGPRSYDGKRVEFPFVNAAGQRDLGATEIKNVINALWRTWAVALAIVCITATLAALA